MDKKLRELFKEQVAEAANSKFHVRKKLIMHRDDILEARAAGLGYERIAKALTIRGISVARRTVAKFVEAELAKDAKRSHVRSLPLATVDSAVPSPTSKPVETMFEPERARKAETTAAEASASLVARPTVAQRERRTPAPINRNRGGEIRKKGDS